MEKLGYICRRFLKFDNESDYFRFVDTVFCVFEMRPPLSKRYSVQAVWFLIKVLHMFENICFYIQMFRCITRTPFNVDEFMPIFFMNFIMTVSMLRSIYLAYYRDSIVKLKAYINSKSCQRDDIEAFELRRNVYQRINKYTAIFVIGSTINILLWAFTTVLNAPILKIPYILDGLPDKPRKVLDIAFVLVVSSQCFAVWINLTQFVTILYTLRIELHIIIRQFERIFRQVTQRHVLYQSSLNDLSSKDRTQFWIDLDAAFKTAISQHSSFMKHFDLLRKSSSLNFCILLATAAVTITGNTFLFILNPEFGRLPLVMSSFQFIFETYFCCSMFTDLEKENDKILYYVYGLDWLSATDSFDRLEQRCCKSIKQNALILQQQVGQGLPIKAGGMYPLTLMTFSDLMKLVYSVLMFLMRFKD